jgi:hypothetical protein
MQKAKVATASTAKETARATTTIKDTGITTSDGEVG